MDKRPATIISDAPAAGCAAEGTPARNGVVSGSGRRARQLGRTSRTGGQAARPANRASAAATPRRPAMPRERVAPVRGRWLLPLGIEGSRVVLRRSLRHSPRRPVDPQAGIPRRMAAGGRPLAGEPAAPPAAPYGHARVWRPVFVQNGRLPPERASNQSIQAGGNPSWGGAGMSTE